MNGRLPLLLQKYQNQADLLSKHEQSSKEKADDALQLFVSILQLNYQSISLVDQKDWIQAIYSQITTENFKQSRLEKEIVAEIKRIDSICDKLIKLAREIEVCALFLTLIERTMC
jgi:hypothetical protein